MKPPILMDFPESFETERHLIRSPLPGDGPELHAAVRESIEELTSWPKARSVLTRRRSRADLLTILRNGRGRRPRRMGVRRGDARRERG
jgi:hypothetical protein